MGEFIILVCGGRDYDNREAVFRALDLLHERRGIAQIINGDARGADKLSTEWAIARGVTFKVYPADWAKHGRRAGPIRNQLMLDDAKPGAVVAFPGGTGTEDMVKRADAAGVPVWRPWG